MADEIELLRLFREEIPGPSTDAWARARAAIAAAQAEEEAGRRRRWPGRRRLLSAGGAAAVATAVGVLLSVLVPGSPARAPGGGALRARETAYVVSRVKQALASPAKTSKVGYSRTVFPRGVIVTVGPAGLTIQGGAGAGSTRSAGLLTARWYRGTAKMSVFTAAGRHVLDIRATTAAGGRAATTVVVNYRDATWWRAASQVPPAPSVPAPRECGQGLDIGPGGWPTFIRYQLSCGGFTAVGRQRADGITAIKLTAGKDRTVLWVDPATYLPVRAILAGRQRIQTDFRWLPPAPAHLAALSLPVPAGYRQVPPP